MNLKNLYKSKKKINFFQILFSFIKIECDGIDNCRNDIDELQCGKRTLIDLNFFKFSFSFFSL